MGSRSMHNNRIHSDSKKRQKDKAKWTNRSEKSDVLQRMTFTVTGAFFAPCGRYKCVQVNGIVGLAIHNLLR